MVIVKSRTAELEYIKCPECGTIFSEEDTEYCHRCKEMICPKCGACGCSNLAFQGRFA